MQNSAKLAQPVLLQEPKGRSLPQGLLLLPNTLMQTVPPFPWAGMKPTCQHTTKHFAEAES